MVHIQYFVKGGKISISTVQKVLSNGYAKKKDNSLDGYNLDHSLSGTRVQVYHNPNTNHTIVSHKGTDSIQDWCTNLSYGLFNDTSGKRFEHSKKIQNEAENKYDGQITTVGHSLGSKLADEATKNSKDREVVTVNGATTPYDLLKKADKDVTNIRTSLDPVSYLQNYKQKNKNDIRIPSKTFNPLIEHSTDTLGRIDGDIEVGQRSNQSSLNGGCVINPQYREFYCRNRN